MYLATIINILGDFLFTEAKEVFDLFDFWDGRDGLVDGVKLGEFLRCCNMNPTQEIVYKHGGTKKLGNTFHIHLDCKKSASVDVLLPANIPWRNLNTNNPIFHFLY